MYSQRPFPPRYELYGKTIENLVPSLTKNTASITCTISKHDNFLFLLKFTSSCYVLNVFFLRNSRVDKIRVAVSLRTSVYILACN